MKPKINIVIMAGLLILMSACNPEPEEVTEDSRVVNVETTEVNPEVFERFLEQVGTVVTNQNIQVSSEVGGRVTEILKRDGSTVKKGEIVIKIDDRRLKQEIKRLEAATMQARDNYERLKRLYDEDSIGSEIDLLNAERTLEQNEATLESAKIDLDNSSIKAPFSGLVEMVSTEVGEMVSAGTPVFRLINKDSKKIRLGVPARFSNMVDLNDEAEIWFDFDEQNRLRLPITFIGNIIDEQNRTFRVEIDLAAATEDIKIDMIANVRLRVERVPEALVVSEEFVYRKNGDYVVYINGTDGNGNTVARQKVVELGSSFGNRVIITNGIEAGETLITLGSSYVQDGTHIRMVENRTGQVTSTEIESGAGE